jgi:hypothetical protein
MIEAVAAVFVLALFGIWKRDDKFNILLKLSLLFVGLSLVFESLREFGYVVNI